MAYYHIVYSFCMCDNACQCVYAAVKLAPKQLQVCGLLLNPKTTLNLHFE